MTGKSITRIDFWRVLRNSIVISLALGYVIQWLRMISNPVDRTGTDFIHFYTVGRIAQRYGFSDAYNLDLHQKIEEQVVGFHLAEAQVFPYNHMPYLIPLLRVLINDNYVGSFVRWVIILLIIYVAGSIFYINSLLPAKESLEKLTLLAVAITFYPFFVSILQGQDTAFIYLGVVLWCIGVLRKNNWLAGIGLALTTIRPHICIMLAFPFLFRNRDIGWRFLISAGILAVISIGILGIHGTTDFVNLLFTTASGTLDGTHQSAMMNLLGLMLRLLPFISENLIRSIAWIGYAFGIGWVSWMWFHAKEFDERLLGISILTAVFFAPHLHYHDLTLLIIPTFMLMKKDVFRLSLSKLITLILAASFLLFISPSFPIAYFSLPYVLLATLAWGLWKFPNYDPAINGKQSISIEGF